MKRTYFGKALLLEASRGKSSGKVDGPLLIISSFFKCSRIDGQSAGSFSKPEFKKMS